MIVNVAAPFDVAACSAVVKVTVHVNVVVPVHVTAETFVPRAALTNAAPGGSASATVRVVPLAT